MPPAGPFVPGCQFIGTHHGGSNPNWWQSGNKFEYQGYINVPLHLESRSPNPDALYPDWDSGSITGGWYVDLTFQNPIESMQFWSGQAEKMDSQGYQWRLIGWCNQTWNNNIDLTYIGRTNAAGINSLASFSIVKKSQKLRKFRLFFENLKKQQLVMDYQI